MQHYKGTRMHLKGHTLENCMYEGKVRVGPMGEVASYLKLRECCLWRGHRTGHLDDGDTSSRELFLELHQAYKLTISLK